MLPPRPRSGSSRRPATRRPANPRQRSPDAQRASRRPHHADRPPRPGHRARAKLLGHVGDVTRFATEHHFASYTGTAPLDASSGKNTRHRLNTGGNRALNCVLHIIAVCQIRDGGRGQDYYLRKIAEGKTPARDRHRTLPAAASHTEALISVSNGASRAR
ncbi:transposase [Streptomyces sp. NPDC013172]|uniref:transposase n=1 Tax=Streptomyces sp. NPDC013172 TaxID=3155009 RepID=UPI0033FCC975